MQQINSRLVIQVCGRRLGDARQHSVTAWFRRCHCWLVQRCLGVTTSPTL